MQGISSRPLPGSKVCICRRDTDVHCPPVSALRCTWPPKALSLAALGSVRRRHPDATRVGDGREWEEPRAVATRWGLWTGRRLRLGFTLRGRRVRPAQDPLLHPPSLPQGPPPFGTHPPWPARPGFFSATARNSAERVQEFSIFLKKNVFLLFLNRNLHLKHSGLI